MATIDNLQIQLNANAEAAIAAINRTASSAERLRGAAQGAAGGLQDTANEAKTAANETANASKQTEKLGSVFKVLGNISKNGTSNIATFWHSITGAVGAISKVTGVSGFAQDALGMLGNSFGSIGQAISKYGILGLPKFFGDELVSSIKKPIAAIGNFVAGIKRIAYYRIIRTIIKEITQAINEGMKSLYTWSKTADGTFKKTMDGLAASTQYLGNSFAAMISPLINALSPAIDFIVDKFVDMFNTISQIIARLTGQTSYTAAKKVAKQWQDASGSASHSAQQAADEIKRTILGFDEINKLDAFKDTPGNDGGGGSGGGGGAAGMFETLPIEGEIVSFADMLKNAFVHGEWHTLGTLLGDKINEMVDSIDWAGTGETVGWYINGWFSTKYWTLDTINFTNIGSKIAEFLNSMIGQIDFNILGRLMVQKFTIVFDMVIGFIETFDWGQAGEKLSNFATGVFQELSKWLQKTDWVKLGEFIVNGIVAFFGSADYSGLAKSASEFLGSALGAAVGLITGLGKAIGEKIGEAFNGIGQFFNEQIEACGGDIVGGILRGIIVGLVNIGVWIVENIFQPFINGFKAAFGIASPAKTMEEPGKNIVLGIFQGIINALVNIGTWVKENIFDPIWNAIKAAGATVIEIAVSLVKKVGEWANDVWDFLQNTGATIAKKVTAAFEAAKSFAGDVWDFIKTGADDIAKTVKAAFDAGKTFVGDVWNTVKAGAENIAKKVTAAFEAGKSFAGDVWNFLKDTGATISKKISTAFEAGKSFAGDVWNFITGPESISKAIEAGVSLVKNGWTTLSGWVGDIGIKLVTLGKNGWTTLSGWIGDIGTKLVTLGKNSWTTISEWVGDIGTKLVSLGKEGWTTLTAWVGNIGEKLVSLGKNGWTTLSGWVGDIGIKLVTLGKNSWTTLSGWVGDIGTKLVTLGKNGWTSISDFVGEIGTKAFDLAMNIIKETKNIINFLRDPVTAVKKVTLSVLDDFTDAVKTMIGFITNKDNKYTVQVSADGQFMVVPSADSGLEETGKGNNKTYKFKNAFNAEAKLTGTSDDSLALVGTDKKKSLFRNKFLVRANLVGAAKGSLALSGENKKKSLFRNKFSVNAKLAGKTSDSLALSGDDKKKSIFRKEFSVKSNLIGKTSKSKSLTSVFGKKFKVNAELSKSSFEKIADKVAAAIKKGEKQAEKVHGAAVNALGGVIKNGRLTRFAYGGIINNGFVRQLPHYAGGSTDAHGTLFVAGEAGPEILGHIGGRTEILNQSQLAQTMFAAVRSAMTGVRIGGYIENTVQTDNGDADYETMYRAMYDAFTDAMTGSNERDKEKVQLMRQIAAKEFTAEVTAASMNRAQTRMNRRAGTTIVPVGT